MLELMRGAPNTVVLEGSYWHRHDFLLVFQFVAGDLGKRLDHLQSDPRWRPGSGIGVPEAEVRDLTRQLVSGMAACHAKGIMQRSDPIVPSARSGDRAPAAPLDHRTARGSHTSAPRRHR